MEAIRLRLLSAMSLSLITSRARRTAYRSLAWPPPKLHYRAHRGAGRHDDENRDHLSGDARRHRRRRRSDQRVAGAVAAADCLFRSNPGAAGAPDQSRSGCRAVRWAVPVADGTRAGVLDSRTGNAGLPLSATPGPGRPAEYAVVSQQSA